MALDDPRFQHDRFLIEQLIRPIVNLYKISRLGAGDEPTGDPIAFVRQKRMALKEDIRFFTDENEGTELFRIKQRKVLDVHGKFDVTAADGAPIGALGKVFGRSLFRSTWRLLEPGEDGAELALVQEKSAPIAIARRLIDFVPYVGDFIPIPYNFEILRGERQIGTFMRKFQVRDRYVLDLSGDPERSIDRRLAIALAIGLDALQNR